MEFIDYHGRPSDGGFLYGAEICNMNTHLFIGEGKGTHSGNLVVMPIIND